MVWCLFQNHYMRHEFKSKNRLDFIQRSDSIFMHLQVQRSDTVFMHCLQESTHTIFNTLKNLPNFNVL